MKKNSKRVIAAALSVFMIVGLCGCTPKSTSPVNKTTGNGEKGRYVESQITLPKELLDGTIFQLSKEEENPVFYVKRNNNDKMEIHKFVLKGDAVEETTPEWMKQITYPAGQYTIEKIQEGEVSIFFYAISDEENMRAYLYKADGDNLLEITPQEWAVPDPEYGYYRFPNDIALLEGGSIAANSYGEIDYYDLNGNKTQNGKYSWQSEDKMAAYKDTFTLMKMSDSYALEGIAFFKNGGTDPEYECKYEQKLEGSRIMDFTEDGQFVMACGDGIFKLNENKEFVEMANGKLTSLSDLDRFPLGILAMKDDVYYILYNSMVDELALMKYEYDPDMPTAPEKELKVSTLYNSYSLQQAAVIYQRENPDTLVTIEAAMPDKYDNEGEEDAVQRMLADMIAGNSADVMILDGLPVQSFIDKGLLLDLSTIVKPMEDNNEVYQNITKLYRQSDGSLPVVPTRFGATMLVGKTLDVTKTENLHAFAEAIAKQEDGVMGPLTTEAIVSRYVPFVMSDLITDKKLDEDVLRTTLQDMKTIAGKAEIVKKYSDSKYEYGIWDIAYKGNLAFDTANGFAEAMFPLAACDLVKGSFTFFGNTYSPSLQVGINKCTTQQEDAEAFVRCLLSVQTQSGEHYEGFPVNKEAMEKLKTMDRTNYAACTDIQTGDDQYDMFEINDFTAEDAQKMVDMCDKLNVCYREDQKVTEEINAVFPRYLDGSLSEDDAIKAVKENVSLYLAE